MALHSEQAIGYFGQDTSGLQHYLLCQQVMDGVRKSATTTLLSVSCAPVICLCLDVTFDRNNTDKVHLGKLVFFSLSKPKSCLKVKGYNFFYLWTQGWIRSVPMLYQDIKGIPEDDISFLSKGVQRFYQQDEDFQNTLSFCLRIMEADQHVTLEPPWENNPYEIRALAASLELHTDSSIHFRLLLLPRCVGRRYWWSLSTVSYSSTPENVNNISSSHNNLLVIYRDTTGYDFYLREKA